MKILVVLGTRPEIIKMAPVIFELQKRKIQFEIVHTGQHYSDNMDRIFWDSFQLPEPKYKLGVQEKTHAKQVAEMMRKLDDILDQECPDWVLVHGDTNSTLSGAIAACKRANIKVAHVEAGLRSFDRRMPEELNRILTDQVSSLLFAPTPEAKKQLLREGVSPSKIRVVGNTIEDILKIRIGEAEAKSDVLSRYQLSAHEFVLLTVHRQENTDDLVRLVEILNAIFDSAEKFKLKVIFPVHPRTRNRLLEAEFNFPAHVIVSEPIGYDDFLVLEKNARMIASDSGGLQEEACILKVPCITLRENTERPETIRIQSNVLAGVRGARIKGAFQKMMKSKRKWKSPYGGGRASQKIIQAILKSKLTILALFTFFSSILNAQSKLKCEKWEQIPLDSQNWHVAYDGFGAVRFQSGVLLKPRAIASESGTHAALVLSKNEKQKDFLVRIKYQNQKAHRLPASNSWEVFWLMFNYQASGLNKKTNYLILKPNGIELGKAWGKVDQEFLKTDTSFKFQFDQDILVELMKKGQRIKAVVNQKDVFEYQDKGGRKLFQTNGQFGLYTEDADVKVTEFSICRVW